MLKMQTMQNQHAMQKRMQMMVSHGSVLGLGCGGGVGCRRVANGGSGGIRCFVGGGVGSSADSIFTDIDSSVSWSQRSVI